MTDAAALASVWPQRARAWVLPLAAILSALAVFAGLQAVAFQQAGAFEYPLDDVYIHLSMAEGMAGGTYGINEGEPSSAASSPVYPVLLTPFAGTDAQRLLPVFWNAIGLGLSALFWGMIVARAGLGRVPSLALAVLGPVALNMPGVAFLGMEHSLHAAATLAVVLGLWSMLQGRGIGPLLWLGVPAMTMLRPEGMALGVLAAVAVVWVERDRPRRWPAGLMLAVLAVLPMAVFSAFLLRLGLDPLPSSVLAKLGDPNFAAMNPAQRVLASLIRNLREPAAWLLAALVVALPVAVRLAQRGAGQRTLSAGAWPLAAVLATAGLAQLLGGQIGWMHRYEHYVIAALVAGFLLCLGPGPDASARARLQGGPRAGAVPDAGPSVRAAARPGASPFPRPGASRALAPASAALLAAAVLYLPDAFGPYLGNPDMIRRQHGQMARFVHDFARRPVAVNDIGKVAWRNPDYVLDLWGLASAEARAARMTAQPGWAGPLVAERGITLAMIYPQWIDEGLPPSWIELGRLETPGNRQFIGGDRVTFYATDPEAAPDLRRLLMAFAKGLPPRTAFRARPGP